MKTIKKTPKLRKIFADSSQKRYVLAVILGTILFLVLSYLIGAFAVPPPLVLYAPIQDVCPSVLTGFTNFCSFVNLSNGGYWKSYIANVNQTNLYLAVSGKFHVNNSTQNHTQSPVIRLRFRHELYDHYHSSRSQPNSNIRLKWKAIRCDIQ